MIRLLIKELLVLVALFISIPILAEENIPFQPTPAQTASAPVAQTLPPTMPAVRIKRGETCPPLPAAWSTWPTDAVSLVGGCQTTSKQQRFHAVKWKLPYSASENTYQTLIADGTFVPLVAGSNLEIIARRPYARTETVRFVSDMATAYTSANCGPLVVTGAGRLTTEIYGDSSPDTVHPFGMAVDLRLRGLEPRCADWIRAYVREKEAQKLIDATEHGHPQGDLHMHVVVVPQAPVAQMAQTGS